VEQARTDFLSGWHEATIVILKCLIEEILALPHIVSLDIVIYGLRFP
jgi:hypothetical protein